MQKVTIAIAVFFLAIVLGSCSSSNATLALRITDMPIEGQEVESVLVTISDAKVHTSNSAQENDTGWVTLQLNGNPTTVDLMNLQNDVNALLGTQSLPTGRYQQLRFTVDSATITVQGEEPADVTIPSGKIKLNLDVTLEEGKSYSVTVDFDAAKSLKLTGNSWRMAPPVIKVREVYYMDGETKVVLRKGSGASCENNTECDANDNELCCLVDEASLCVERCGDCETTCADGEECVEGNCTAQS